MIHALQVLALLGALTIVPVVGAAVLVRLAKRSSPMPAALSILCDTVAAVPICPIAGGARTACAYCAVECWITPASRALMAVNPGSNVVCRKCAGVHARGAQICTTAAHLAEARSALRSAEAN